MSHADYIAELDEGQLRALIAASQQRLEAINDTGWVKLWVAGCPHANWAWFAEDDYVGSVTWLASKGVRLATSGQPSELTLELIAYRPHEAERLLRDMAGPAVAAPAPVASTRPQDITAIARRVWGELAAKDISGANDEPNEQALNEAFCAGQLAGVNALKAALLVDIAGVAA